MTDKPKKPHHRTGRKKKRLKPKDYPIIESMASAGHDERTIARAVGIGGIDTWKRLLKDDSNAAEAFNAGRSAEHDLLYGLLRKAATDGHPASAMFLLKCRHGYREQAPPPEESRIRIEVMSLPAPMSREQYMKTIEHHQPVIEQKENGE